MESIELEKVYGKVRLDWIGYEPIKIDIMYLTDFMQAERLRCIGGTKQYVFKICSFTPKSAMLGERIIGDKEARGNVCNRI